MFRRFWQTDWTRKNELRMNFHNRISSVHKQYREIGEPESFGRKAYYAREVEIRALIAAVLDKMAEIEAAKRLRRMHPADFIQKYPRLPKALFKDIYGVRSDIALNKLIQKGLPYHEDLRGIWFAAADAEAWFGGE